MIGHFLRDGGQLRHVHGSSSNAHHLGGIFALHLGGTFRLFFGGGIFFWSLGRAGRLLALLKQALEILEINLRVVNLLQTPKSYPSEFSWPNLGFCQCQGAEGQQNKQTLASQHFVSL